MGEAFKKLDQKLDLPEMKKPQVIDLQQLTARCSWS